MSRRTRCVCAWDPCLGPERLFGLEGETYIPCTLAGGPRVTEIAVRSAEKNRASQVALAVKNTLANAGDPRDAGLIPRWGRPPGGRKWQPTSVFLPGKSHGQRREVEDGLWGGKELDTT